MNSNVVGIKQNDKIVGIFGDKFTSGNSFGPVYITVQGDVFAQIVAVYTGLATNQCGFVVKAPNGTVIYQKSTGVSPLGTFPSGNIFANFCPVGGCLNSAYTVLTVTCTDSFGDGWNKNYLGIRQNNLTTAFIGLYFTSGASNGPTQIILQSNAAAQIFVASLGTKTN